VPCGRTEMLRIPLFPIGNPTRTEQVRACGSEWHKSGADICSGAYTTWPQESAGRKSVIFHLMEALFCDLLFVSAEASRNPPSTSFGRYLTRGQA
jgi:hypothetical protein